MAKDLTALTNEIRRYAESRRHDVSRGAETPALAALMVEKFGEGLVKAGYLLGLDSPPSWNMRLACSSGK